MLYKDLAKIVTSVENFRWLPSIYEVREMPYSTHNEKMSLVIRLIRLINWMSYQWSIWRIDIQRAFNKQTYRQAIANASTYWNKSDIVVGKLVDALWELVSDLNIWIPAKPNLVLLAELVNKEIETNEMQDYTDFFANSLTDEQKELIEQRKRSWWLTGQDNNDWQVMSFILKDGENELVISDRLWFMKLTNVIIIQNIEELLKQDHCPVVEFIFNNIDKVAGTSRKPTYALLLQALLFRQTFDKYPWLIKANETIKLLINN